jgi:hypothetical protein
MLVRAIEAYIESNGSTVVPLWNIHIVLNYISPIDNEKHRYYLTIGEADKIIQEGKHTLFGNFLLLWCHTEIGDYPLTLQLPRKLLYDIQQNIETVQIEATQEEV